MKNFFGRFSQTLSSQVNQAITETVYKNRVFLNSRWRFAEKNIVLWSTSYKKYILLACLLACLVTINFIMWGPWIKPFVIQLFPHWRGQLDWQSNFLGGQLTIVGVVYPLVVGLISVLFQNKSAKKVIFPLYQKYSGFMFAGLSGLALSGFIVIGFFLRSAISDSQYAAITLTTSLWFLSNLVLTAWFFVKTFRMLEETSREAIVFRFSIQQACEVDVRRLIKQSLIDNAVHNKLIHSPDEKVMNVFTHEFSGNSYKDITRRVAREKTLKDVRFWALNSAIWVQICFLNLKRIQGGKLVIQPQRGSRTGNIIALARYDGFNINPLVQVLIKIAFSFEKKNPHVDVGLSTVLNGFIGPANDAIRDGDAREFSVALGNLALWHTELSEALSFKNDEGNLDNWLIWPNDGPWSRSYLDELMGEYYRLARETIERIPDNSRFYTDMLYFYKRIFSRRDTLIIQEMRSLIEGSYYMWYLLVEWRSYNSASNDLRVANKYEDILYDFVGAWESWLMYIEPRSKRTGDINKTYPAFIKHLELTASTAISALRFGNFEAAGWGVDMLNNWIGQLLPDDHLNAEYSWHSVLINHFFLPMESTSDTWQYIIRGNEYDYRSAFNLSFRNAHVDLRVITACYMLLKPGEDQPDLLARYVKTLLSGARIHSSNFVEHSHHNNIFNAGDLLGAFIRQRDYRHSGQSTYGTWFSSLLESFGRIYEERRVSGRIYTGWGASGPQSMNRAYVEIAIYMSDNPWRMSNDWEKALFSGFFGHMDQMLIISDLNDWINIANEDRDYLLVDNGCLQSFKNNFIQSVQGIIQKIKDTQNQLVTLAEIDQVRLTNFGIAISAFLKEKGAPNFPFLLFKHVNQDTVLDNSYCIENFLNYRKEDVSSGIDAGLSNNDVDYLIEYFSDKIKLEVLRSLLKNPHSASYKYTDTSSFLSDIRLLSTSIVCPVLFVGNQTIKTTLRGSFQEPTLAGRYDIGRQDGFENEYICHVGNCEVYSLIFCDIDYCVLTSKELFDTVSFGKIADDQYVKVNYELNEGSDTDGRLIFRYRMKINLTEETPCIKLELITNDDDKT